MSCEFLFTSCKVILRVVDLFCKLEIKLRVASCFLQVPSCFFTSCKFQEIILRVVFYELKIKNIYFMSLPVAVYELKL